MKRIGSENKKNIYMATPKRELLYKNSDQSVVNSDQSVVDFVKQYDEGTLVKLR